FASIVRLGGGRGMLAGVLAGIERGWFLQEIADAAWRQQVQVEKKRRIIVGVNEFVEPDEHDLEILRISQEVEREQAAALGTLRAGRIAHAVTKAIDALREAARGSDNLIPL